MHRIRTKSVFRRWIGDNGSIAKSAVFQSVPVIGCHPSAVVY